MLIGLSGYARSGKDTAAEVLVEEFGYERVAFADKLRDFLYALNPIVTADAEHVGSTPTTYYCGSSFLRVQQVIDKYGWSGYKESPFSDDIRGNLQRLGTEAGRQVLGENIWVDAALTGASEGANIVVTDVRFPNEAAAVRSRGGALIRIEREGIGPANAHASETSLDDYPFDGELLNDGTLDDFRNMSRTLGELYDKQHTLF